ncbi:serine/arginine repetitive matrix protein 1-like [Oryza brachyantha]|uniref:serine/arginine repetitive matrix protein 1-like n=1 Tax=Oryza brachyantha TaxID=4533 RepID=UPI001ADAF65C|nr:serine/arginine repetitive matrix protein 1-like [Oryza brachyantha]
MQPPEAMGASSSASGAPRRRSIGCMAGLLRLLSPYHRSHQRKRLTAKNAAPVVCTPPPSPPPVKKKLPVVATPSPSQGQQAPQMHPAPTALRRRRSCDAPRSPTIAPEHRRASCDSPRPTPPAIVARLMGLEESAPPSPAATTPRPFPTKPPPPPPETAAEKRRKLLGALEKCDEDLKTLRRIIAAVRAAEMQAAAASDVPTPEATDKGSYDQWKDGRDADPSPSPSPSPQKPRSEEHYPSPDSVLDAITSPRFPCRKRSSPCTDLDADRKLSSGIATVGSKIVKPSRTLVFSGDYCKIRPCNELHAVAMYHHPVVAIEAIPRWMPPLLPSSEIISWRHRRRWGLEAAASGRSRAMAESVGEVWGQGADEERHEAGRVGAALERAILHDLVGDVVAELLTQPPPHPSSSGHGAGAAMCRKRLVF